MVLLDSVDAFFSELGQMFALCKERGAGTVYSTVKRVEAGNKQHRRRKPGKGLATGMGEEPMKGGGRREGWLVRAKISNNKMRKISLLVSETEIAHCRERLERVLKAMPPCAIAGGTKKRGRKPAGGEASSTKTAKKAKGSSGT